MPDKKVKARISNLSLTSQGWTEKNPVLKSGEIGYETDTGKFKIGNGSSNWVSLPYNVESEISKELSNYYNKVTSDSLFVKIDEIQSITNDVIDEIVGD